MNDDLLDYQDDPVGLDNHDDFILTKEIWETIGAEIHQSWTTVPSVYGRPLRNIMKYWKSFKAAEWSNRILLYSVLLLHVRMTQ